MGKCKEMAGMRFGRLTVIERAENSKNGTARWLCKCDCGNTTIVNGNKLRTGNTTSCGCYWKEKIIEGSIRHNKKMNDTRKVGGVVFVKLPNSEQEMKVDEDVWDRWAKDYRWRLGNCGYAITRTRSEGTTVFHIRAFPDCPEGKIRDHIDGDRLNNTRENIRFVTPAQNMFNRGVGNNNTSGYNGVYFHNDTGKWAAEIKIDRKKKHLGLFDIKEDAIAERKKAEIKYFGEYRRNK